MIKQLLQENVDVAYQSFATSLIPNVENLMGVRIPVLRSFVKQWAKEDWRAYYEQLTEDSFEEIMLQGMLIGAAPIHLYEKWNYVQSFVPKINNWSVCDSFCVGLKSVSTDLPWVWEQLQPYLSSKQEYEVRFGVVITLMYFTKDEYLEEALSIFSNIKHEEYYVTMAIGWAIAEFFVFYPERIYGYLQLSTLKTDVQRKAIQKIVESNRVSADWKERVKVIKRRR